MSPFGHETSSRLLLPAAIIALLSGCTTDETINAVPRSPDDGGAPTVPTLAAGWTEILPGGDTVCSRGTPYAYFVRPGTVNKLVIDFIGGGACWNEFTCSIADAIFEEDVESVRAAVSSGVASGFYDHDNAANPFKDWYHVVVPYCTGDIHWGDAVTKYGDASDPIVINHKGAVNSRAVLDWVYANFSAPEHIMVTGCSAGSYGAALWSAHVMQHYPSSRVLQFGDSGAGIITEEFFHESFPSWNANGAFPTFIPGLDPNEVNIETLALPDLYAGIGNHFTTQRVSQYNTAFDENQTFFYTAMGGKDAEEWSGKMFGFIDTIEDKVPNFTSFIPSGEQHCILPYDNFYTVNVNGRLLTSWLTDLLGEGEVASERCAEADCKTVTP